ncbi:MAG: glycosyltransferase, partial [Nitriliruptorales bacterium]
GRTGPAELGALAHERGVAAAVRVVGALPQRHLAELYRAASVVLMPSRSESFGLVGLEAQACGTPVVAADVGGLRAVVEGGFLVAGHDPQDHAAAVVELLTRADVRADAIEHGLRRAHRASWEDTVTQLLDVYAETSRSAPELLRRLGA